MNTTERALRLLYFSSSNSQKWGSDGRGPRMMRLVLRGRNSKYTEAEGRRKYWTRIHIIVLGEEQEVNRTSALL